MIIKDMEALSNLLEISIEDINNYSVEELYDMLSNKLYFSLEYEYISDIIGTEEGDKDVGLLFR